MQLVENTDERMIRKLERSGSAGCVAVAITNWREIQIVFGDGPLAEIEQLICGAFARLFPGSALEKYDPSSFRAIIPDVTPFNHEGDIQEGAIARAICSIVMADAVRTTDCGVIPYIEVVCTLAGQSAPTGAAFAELEAHARSTLALKRSRSRQSLAAGASDYAATMGRANAFLGHLLNGDMSLLSEPVCRAADNGVVYEHFSPAILRSSVLPVSAESMYQDLCALGAPRETDEFLVWKLLVELLQDRNLRAGVRICGQSARLDHWWSRIIELLEGNRQLACRLVLETDGAFSSFGEADKVQFCRKMKSLGVTIVLGQFGTGASGLRDILTLQPNYAKLEPGFLWRAQTSEDAFLTLKHLIGLSASLHTAPIISGADSEELAHLAVQAGANWISGSLLGSGRTIHLLQGGEPKK
jgi:EAL domain-containing protein (putative c-di-GMP-specific phosphodiesterase class I)